MGSQLARCRKNGNEDAEAQEDPPSGATTVAYYKLEHSWGLSRTGTSLDTGMAVAVAEFIKTHGQDDSKSHTFQSQYGERTIKVVDNCVCLNWGPQRDTSELFPAGYRHTQWVIAVPRGQCTKNIEAVKRWLELPETEPMPLKTFLQDAAKEIWTIKH
mmetsp:Transcript_5584/g.10481  ORF Transcript_5584/g.10481 Transcript_5584/m.10481 type:complete len:158 (+) Transcript_5584:129-602(+)